MNSTGNASNDKSKGLTNSLQTLDKESVDFPGSIRYYINNEGALMPRPSRKDTQKMATIYLATAADMTLAFSNIGSAFTFIQDSHADLNPEGSTLMLRGVPATNKAVKGARGDLRFNVSGADAASQVAAAQSKLDGAIAACALVGVDPSNVAKVAELRENLETAMSSALDGPASVELTIRAMVLHKRGYKK